MATVERVNAAGRNDVYKITLDCGCEVRHEPDAPAPYDWELRQFCPAWMRHGPFSRRTERVFAEAREAFASVPVT